MRDGLSNLSVCVIDTGLSCAFAERLARPGGFGRVFYYCPNPGSFLTPQLSKIGTGFNRVERVRHYLEVFEECDLFIFLDCCFGPEQEFLRRQGKLTFGSGNAAELENRRWYAKEAFEKLGLPVVPSVLVRGVDNLRAYLKEHPKTWVKISEFRGISETFFAENYELARQRLDMIQHSLGILADEQEFVCEQPIEAPAENGGDFITADGGFGKYGINGIESKMVGYICAALPYDQIPKVVRETNDKLAPMLKAYSYRGLFSTEIREDKKRTAFPTDLTCRYPSPPGEIIQEMILNLPEVVLGAARGELVEWKLKSRCAVELILYSDFAPKETLAVQYPPEIADSVKLYNSLRRNGTDYVVPTDESFQVGAVTGFADTFKEAAENALENAKQVKGDRIEVKEDVVEKLMQGLRDSKAKGVTFGDLEIPDV